MFSLFKRSKPVIKEQVQVDPNRIIRQSVLGQRPEIVHELLTYISTSDDSLKQACLEEIEDLTEVPFEDLVGLIRDGSLIERGDDEETFQWIEELLNFILPREEDAEEDEE